ncbi:hypothetical protein ACFVXQ_20085, partial [Kitasatospora sp. NPDC058263]
MSGGGGDGGFGDAVFGGLDVRGAPGDGPVAFGARLGPDVLLAAYRHGLFPMPAADDYASAFNEVRFEEAVAAGEVALLPGAEDDPYALAWWSP